MVQHLMPPWVIHAHSNLVLTPFRFFFFFSAYLSWVSIFYTEISTDLVGTGLVSRSDE